MIDRVPPNKRRTRNKALLSVYFALLVAICAGGYWIGLDKTINYTTVRLDAPMGQGAYTKFGASKRAGSEAGSVKFVFSLSVPTGDSYRVGKYMPLIMDRIQVVLNQTPAKDFKNAEALSAMRERILSQINEVSGPVHIKDIYFEKLITIN